MNISRRLLRAALPALLAGALAMLLGRAVADPSGPAPVGGYEALSAASRYVSSRRFATCHLAQTPSWRRTYRRTMTQLAATRGAVVALFRFARAARRDGRLRGIQGNGPDAPSARAVGPSENGETSTSSC